MNGQQPFFPVQLNLGNFALPDFGAIQPAAYFTYLPQALLPSSLPLPVQMPPPTPQTTHISNGNISEIGGSQLARIAHAVNNTSHLSSQEDSTSSTSASAAWKVDDLVAQLLGTVDPGSWSSWGFNADCVNGAGDSFSIKEIPAEPQSFTDSDDNDIAVQKTSDRHFGPDEDSRKPKPISTVRAEKEAVWTGTMPVRVYKNARFSQKVFVGGLPLMVKSSEIQKVFSPLGSTRIILPKTRGPSGANQIHGYCHIVLKDGKSVKRLLTRCQKNVDNPEDSIMVIVQSYEYFYEMQLGNAKKNVQIIPWCINDSHYTHQMSNSGKKHVVFVGALHGIMTAEFLGRVMSDLFGNIEFVTLDTDRFEYPIGSARVGFTSRESYMKALKTNFVKIKTSRFSKVVQIEPYLEDSACSVCAQCIGVNFCKSDMCFRYYCTQCWERMHACLDHRSMMEHQRLNKKRQEESV